MAKKQIGLALVGLGMAAKPHLAALAALAGTDGRAGEPAIHVTGIYNRSIEKSDAVGAEFGWPVFASLEAIAQDPATDGVILLTPPDQRLDPIMQLAAGGKHILCEKPLERSLAASEQIVSFCEAIGVSLGVVFQHRFRAGAQALRQLIDDGALGEIALVRADIPWWRGQDYYDVPGRGTYARDGGGVMMTQAIHVMDLMLSLAPDLTSVQAMCATSVLHEMEAEDFVTAGLRFANGAVGSLMATTATYPGSTEQIVIDGTKGSAHLLGGSLTVHWRDGRKDQIDEADASGGGADPMDFPCDWHKALIADFAEAIAHDRPPLITGREALKVHRLIDALEHSAKSAKPVGLTAAV